MCKTKANGATAVSDTVMFLKMKPVRKGLS